MSRQSFSATVLVAASLVALTNTSFANQYYLLIGIENYDRSPHMPNLRFANDDVRGLESLLLDRGIPADNIFVVCDDAESTRRPTSESVANAFRTLKARIAKEDSVMVAFAGHGVTIENEGYLCLPNFSVKVDGTAKTSVDDNTVLPLARFFRLLSELPASQRVAVIDACRNFIWDPNGEADTHVERFDLSRYSTSLTVDGADSQGVAVLASCLTGEVAIEDAALKHGLFFHYIIDGLSGSADFRAIGNRDGQVSLFEVFDYCQTEVFLASNERQRPVLTVGVTANFPLMIVPEARIKELRDTHAVPRSFTIGSAKIVAARKEFGRAVVSLSTGNLAEVIARCSAALRLDKNYTDARRLRAHARLIRGDVRTAALDLDKLREVAYVTVSRPKTQLTLNWRGGSPLRKQTLVPGTTLRIVGTIGSHDVNGNPIADYKHFVRVTGLQRSGTSDTEELTAWIDARQLQPISPDDQLRRIQEFQLEAGFPVTEGAAGARSKEVLASANMSREMRAHGLDRAMDIYANSWNLAGAIQSRNPQAIVSAAIGLRRSIRGGGGPRRPINLPIPRFGF